MKKVLLFASIFIVFVDVTFGQKQSTQQMIEKAQQDISKMNIEKQQTKPKVNYVSKLDTVITICLVVTNQQTAESKTMFLTKVYGQVYDFIEPNEQQLKGDSLTLKKQLIPVKRYFVTIDSEVIDSKTKKKTIKSELKEIPSGFVLIDFENNFSINSDGR